MNNNINSLYFFMPGICYLIEYLVWKSFPQSHALNGLLGGLWTVGQIGVLAIVYEMYRRRLTGNRKARRVGLMIAALGATAYIVNYVFGYWLNMNTRLFLPLGALLTAIGMVITGIQVLRARVWQGKSSIMPLLVGLYPFVIMFPVLFATGRPDLTAIMLWGIPWLLLGIALFNLCYLFSRETST